MFSLHNLSSLAVTLPPVVTSVFIINSAHSMQYSDTGPQDILNAFSHILGNASDRWADAQKEIIGSSCSV